jgi:hypothetical protein
MTSSDTPSNTTVETAFGPLLDEALASARALLARRGNLMPFALRAGEAALHGEGASNTAQLEAIYQILREKPEQPTLVVSEGSSNAHANLLVVYAEHPAFGAARGIGVISYRHKPLFIGPVCIRAGAVNLGALDWQTVTARIAAQN